MESQIITVGAILRGRILRDIQSIGLNFTEVRGLLDSQVRVSGTPDQMAHFRAYVVRIIAMNDAIDRAEEELRREAKANKRWWKPSTWID